METNLKVLKRGNAKDQFYGFAASEDKERQNKFTSYNIFDEDIKKFKPLIKLYDRADVINDIA